MINFDFETYTKKFINIKKYNELLKKRYYYFNKIKDQTMTGFLKPISNALLEEIIITANYVKDNFDCMVVIGIGGSFLGSFAFDKMFKRYFNNDCFEVIYIENFSSKYIEDLLENLNDKNVCLNVISKSGNTMEIKILYNLLKDFLKEKYSEKELVKRIIITTDKEKGLLREEANKVGYKSFEIPKDIGGRYSFLTAAHLFPLALNYDIKEIVEGYFEGEKLFDDAYKYAVIRKLLFESGKYIENYCIYEDNMYYFTEWLKQLFGESEGKDGNGIFPASTVYTRDLHSLGQFIQDGNKIIFETVIKVNNNYTKNIYYNDMTISKIIDVIYNSVLKAHYNGDVPNIKIEIENLNLRTMSQLIYFFMVSAAFSALLFEVDPFNQPGVEAYKKKLLIDLGVEYE